MCSSKQNSSQHKVRKRSHIKIVLCEVFCHEQHKSVSILFICYANQKKTKKCECRALHTHYTSIRMEGDKKAFHQTHKRKQNKWHLGNRELRLCLRVCLCVGFDFSVVSLQIQFSRLFCGFHFKWQHSAATAAAMNTKNECAFKCSQALIACDKRDKLGIKRQRWAPNDNNEMMYHWARDCNTLLLLLFVCAILSF